MIEILNFENHINFDSCIKIIQYTLICTSFNIDLTTLE